MEELRRNSREPEERLDAGAPRFEDQVELGKAYSPAEAIALLAAFHDTSEDAVRAAFFNLKHASPEDSIVFAETHLNNERRLKYVVIDKAGEQKTFSLLYADTGQPIMHQG